MSSLDSFFASIKLPSMSEVAHAVIKTLNDENASVMQVSNIIGHGPALPGLDRNQFWKGCMACAGYAQWMRSTYPAADSFLDITAL